MAPCGPEDARYALNAPRRALRALGRAGAAAGWSHDMPEILGFMTQTCVAYFQTVAEFGAFVLR